MEPPLPFLRPTLGDITSADRALYLHPPRAYRTISRLRPRLLPNRKREMIPAMSYPPPLFRTAEKNLSWIHPPVLDLVPFLHELGGGVVARSLNPDSAFLSEQYGRSRPTALPTRFAIGAHHSCPHLPSHQMRCR